MLLKDLDAKFGLMDKENIIFYVSDSDDLKTGKRIKKMDTTGSLVSQLTANVKRSRAVRYTEYDGELIDAQSIGIVFPAHNWGISIAVLTFLQHLRFRKGTYLYAVCVGENLSVDNAVSLKSTLKSLEQFSEIFGRRSEGHASDIFVKCTDFRRSMLSTEEKLSKSGIRGMEDKNRWEISCVLEGMLFFSAGSLPAEKVISERRRVSEEEADTMYHMLAARRQSLARESRAVSSRSRSYRYGNAHAYTPDSTDSAGVHSALSNIFLDDDVFSGVRLKEAL